MKSDDIQSRRSVLKKTGNAIGGLAVGVSVIGTARADYCDVVYDKVVISSVCAARQAQETTTFQYVDFGVTTGNNPDGDLYIETSYGPDSEVPDDYSNFDVHEPIDSSSEGVRLYNWEVDGYMACLVMNNDSADFLIEECG